MKDAIDDRRAACAYALSPPIRPSSHKSITCARGDPGSRHVAAVPCVLSRLASAGVKKAARESDGSRWEPTGGPRHWQEAQQEPTGCAETAFGAFLDVCCRALISASARAATGRDTTAATSFGGTAAVVQSSSLRCSRLPSTVPANSGRMPAAASVTSVEHAQWRHQFTSERGSPCVTRGLLASVSLGSQRSRRVGAAA